MTHSTRQRLTLLLILMMLLNLTPLPAGAQAQLLTVLLPATDGLELAAPVEIIVRLDGQSAASFRAELNGRDVTHLFAPLRPFAVPLRGGTRRARFERQQLRIGLNQFTARWRGLFSDQLASRSFIFTDRKDLAAPPGASSRPRYVPIQTRVISGDGTQASDYAIKVGDTTYSAPDLSGGGATGYQFLLLNRETLELVSNVSIPTTNQSEADVMQYIVSIPRRCGEYGCLAVLQSLQYIGWTPRCDIKFPENCYREGQPPTPGQLAAQLGDPTNGLDYVNGYTPQAGYSLISNFAPGSSVNNSSGNSRLTCDPKGVGQCGNQFVTIANGGGAISGALVKDNNLAYTFAYPGRATFETGTGVSSTSNTITVNGNAYQSGTIPNGSGAFQVVIVSRDSLQLVSNDTFNFAQLAGSSARNMQGVLENVVANRNLLVFISSIGNLSHSELDIGWSLVGKQIEKLGGTYSVFAGLGPNDDYSFVGAKDTTHADGAVEASSIVSKATRLAGSNVPPSNVRGVLAQDFRGNYRPTLSRLKSTDPNQEAKSFADFSLAQVDAIALQPPTPWPAMSVAEQKAYRCISGYLQHIASQNPCGWDGDVRANYTDSNFDFGTKHTTLDELSYDELSYKQNQDFTAADFESVRTQLRLEFTYGAAIVLFYGNIDSLYTKMQDTKDGILHLVHDAVMNSLQPPSSTKVAPKWQAVISGAETITGDLASLAGGPALKLGLDLFFVTANISMAFANDSNGNNLQNLETTFDALEQKSIDDFFAMQTNVGNLFDLILSDWGRLQKLGEPLRGGLIQWDRNLDGAVEKATSIALRREYFPRLMAATVYQLGWWPKIQSGIPPDLQALYPFTAYRTCPPKGINCPCHFDAPSSDPENWLALPSSVTNLIRPIGPVRDYDIWYIGGDPFCSGNNDAGLLAPLFAPLDPDDSTKLGIYKPYFFLYNSQGTSFSPNGPFSTTINGKCGKGDGLCSQQQ